MKQYCEALFLRYRPRTTECSISQFCDTNCYHSIFRTIEARVGFSWTVKKISKITYTASRFSLLQCELWRVFEWTLIELSSNIINNLLLIFIFIQWFNARHFEYSCKRCSLNNWKQTAQRLKLQERLLTTKRNIIRWNIYRDNNVHSRRQVLKCQTHCRNL